MPNSQIVCAYTARAVGSIPIATVAANLAAVPLDTDTLTMLGLRVLTDAMTTGALITTRTITLGMNPSSTATATVSFIAGDGSGSPIRALALTGGGLDYVVPPIVTFTGDGAGAKAVCSLDVGVVAIDAPGVGYIGIPTVTFVGGQLAQGGKQATGVATVDGFGHVSGVTIVTPGGPYFAVPTIVFSHPGGATGAIARARMRVGTLTLVSPGIGYQTVVVVFTPYFKVACPDSSPQGSVVSGWMTAIFQDELAQPISTAVPVVS